MQRWKWWTVGSLVVGALVSGLLAGRGRPALTASSGAGERVIWLAAVEYKGAADAAKEPFPRDVRPPGPGIRLGPLEAENRWETEVYRWDTGVIAAYSGEMVKLRVWGVNGVEHPSYIEQHVPNFTVRRGRLTELEFRAGAPGLYRIVCLVHPPSMVAHLMVLPRP